MKNCNKIKHTCGSGRNFAVCIETEGEVNADSTLVGETCTNLQENLDDIYNQLENLDLSALGELCLTYVQEDNKNIVKNVLLKHEEKICEYEERINELETINVCKQSITSCNLDFGDLVDACGNQPTTLAEVLQIILTQLNTP